MKEIVKGNFLKQPFVARVKNSKTFSYDDFVEYLVFLICKPGFALSLF